jgi:hypothetical protein
MLDEGKNTWHDTGKTTCYSMFYVPGQYDEADNRFVQLRGHVLSAAEWLEISPPPPAEEKPPRIAKFDHTVSSDRIAKSDYTPMDSATLADLVEHIPTSYADSFDDWNRVGMALWRTTCGSEEGLELFDFFSRQSKKYDGSAVGERWYGYMQCQPNHVTVGTLFYLAKEGGWHPPKQMPKRSKVYSIGKGPQTFDELMESIISVGQDSEALNESPGEPKAAPLAGVQASPVAGPRDMDELIAFLAKDTTGLSD